MRKITFSLILFTLSIFFSYAQSICSEATSLCGSFGSIFSNTTGNSNIESEFEYDCLASQPNPTWFYIPIAASGDLNFQISQFTNMDGSGQQLDVDFIVWGPFSDSTCSTEDLVIENVVDCSFSAAAIETVSIPNVQPGETYMLLVTNFSGDAGYIEMTETNGTTFFDAVDCTGFNFNAFIDTNGNDIKDEEEVNFPHGALSYVMNTNDEVVLNNGSGKFYIYDNDTSNNYDFEYTINSNYSSYYSVASPAIENQSVVSGEIRNLDIAVDLIQPYADASVSIVPIDSPNPGFNTSQLITYSNLSSTEITSGTITYTFDDNTTFVSSDDPNTTQNNNTLSIPFTNFLPFETREIEITLNTNAPPAVNIDDALSFSSEITIDGLDDINLNDNTFSLDAIVVGSFDPNDKLESHGGSIVYEDFTSEDYLVYTIRFQNTGTASAQNVVIKDFLTDELDGSTVLMLNASHPFQLKKMGQDLEWEFRNINLPDSTNDEPNSHGFVQFKVKPTSGYTIETVFENTAEIYFDFNLPIITETNITTFRERLSINESEIKKVSFYPNPTKNSVFIKAKDVITHLKLINTLGQTLMSKQINSTETSIDLSKFAEGQYFITLQSKNGLIIKRIVKN